MIGAVEVRQCKDCLTQGVTTRRVAKYPGPRCTTHHRAKRNADRLRAAGQRVEKTFGISPELYEAILEAQGGGCGWCGRKPRKGGRRLAVDHDHACCAGPVSCGKCVRGALCWSCNKSLQHLGDDPERVERGADYLRNPPAKGVLKATATV